MPALPRFGVFPLDDGTCEFRVWAPNSGSVSVRLVSEQVPERVPEPGSEPGSEQVPEPGSEQVPEQVPERVPEPGSDTVLRSAGEGVFEGHVPARHGDDYLFVLDEGMALPDPCSRFQPHGLNGPSRVVDTSRLAIAPGPELDRERLVVYELHVGTFSDEGTFDGAIPHLPALADLGVTAIEPMPVATFPGERGWGYDGVYSSAQT